MPDTPDYDKYRPNSVRFSLQDMGELAARMGSPVVYDRRGEVLFSDTFEYGLTRYSTNGSGGLGAFNIDASSALFGGYSGQLVTGATDDNYQAIKLEFSPSEVNRIGAETSLVSVDNLSEIELRLFEYDGTIQKQFRVRIDNENDQIKILNSGGTYTVVDLIGWFNSVDERYRFLKLVGDFNTGKYVRLLIDKFEYDLSDYDGFSSAISEQYGIQLQISLFTRSATSISINIGHIIITGNEP